MYSSDLVWAWRRLSIQDGSGRLSFDINGSQRASSMKILNNAQLAEVHREQTAPMVIALRLTTGEAARVVGVCNKIGARWAKRFGESLATVC